MSGTDFAAGKRSRRRSSRWVVAVIVATASVGIILSLYSFRLFSELEILRSTTRDNVQWSLAQLEVEYLVLMETVEDAAPGDLNSLKNVRQRFDIFYSRVSLIASSEVFNALAMDADSRKKIAALQTTLDDAIPLIDGDRETLGARLGELEASLEAERANVRQIALHGVRLFAEATDARRAALSDSLINTAIVALCLIILLALVLAILARQNEVAGRREEALRLSSLRFVQTIDASLTGIIIADDEGKVVEFNPAAERIFGYTKNAALGRNVGDLIVPPKLRQAHHKGLERYHKTGVAHVIGRQHVELEGMRSSGEIFPVELAIARTTGPDGDLFVGYLRDVTKRVETERQLREARDKAFAAARAKSQFLAVMSHEMRTPLNGVIAVLDLLDSTELDAKQKEFVKTAILSGELLQRHIDDVLDIARIEAGGLQLQPRPFDLTELLNEIARINRPTAEARGNTITVATRLPAKLALADRARLSQVMMNLVGNAIKFTENGLIWIGGALSKSEPEIVEINVSDNGIGIAKDDQARIFDDFVTLDPSYRRTASGYGLGLSICQRIVKAMGGEICVDSAVGRGSRFTVRIPIEFIGEEAKPVDTTDPANREPKIEGALKILLVEDNEINSFAAREMLMREGCQVTEARDGLVGLSLAEADRYDLILMDVSMPRLDGIEATRAIRAGKGASHDVPIVGLTAHALPEEQEKLMEAGMQDCLFKPLRSHNLRELLSRYASLAGEASANSPLSSGPADENEPVDHTVLDDLAKLLPSADFEATVDMFCAELNELPGALRELGTGDLAAVRKRAHKTAGSAAVLGATGVHDVLATIEDACSNDEEEFVEPLISELESLAPITIDILRSRVTKEGEKPVA